MKNLLVFIAGIEVPLSLFPVLFAFGILLWTLDEYVVHRWLFHMRPPANSKLLIRMHFLLHGQHHKVRENKYKLLQKKLASQQLILMGRQDVVTKF